MTHCEWGEILESVWVGFFLCDVPLSGSCRDLLSGSLSRSPTYLLVVLPGSKFVSSKMGQGGGRAALTGRVKLRKLSRSIGGDR